MRGRSLLRGLLPAVAVLGLLVGAVPAHAAAEGRIGTVTPTDGQVVLTFAGSDLGSAELDPADVLVEADGRTLEATAAGVASADPTTALDRSVMLVVDTSGSMAGERITSAEKAVRSFLRSLPADVRLGLTTFAEDADVVVEPVLDRRPVEKAVDGLVPLGGTSLYDGVVAATRALGSRGERRVVVLSDGADSRSSASLGRAVQQVERSGVSVSAVRFGTDDGGDEALRRLAAAGGGKVVAVSDAAGLAAALRRAAPVRVAQVQITAAVPAALAGRTVQLHVAVATTGDERLEDTAEVRLAGTTAGPAPAYVPPRRSWLATPAAYRAGAVGVGLGLLLMVGLFLGVREQSTGDSGRTKRLLTLYTMRPQAEEPTTAGALAKTQIARTAVEFAGRVARRRGLEERLALRLDRAGVALRPAEFILLQGGMATGALLVLLLLTGKPLLALLVGVVAGLVLPRLVLRVKAGRRQTAFVADMPDALQLVAGSLSAGYSLPQALDAVVRGGNEPIAGEIGRAMAESRLGVSVEEALDNVAVRMDVDDFRWVVMAIRVQREVGGNLAGVLSTVSATMRDRARLRRTVRALSAEGRLSAYVLIGLPIGISAFMLAFRREYMRPLYTEGLGVFLLIVATTLVVVGAVWMSKLVKVEV